MSGFKYIFFALFIGVAFVASGLSPRNVVKGEKILASSEKSEPVSVTCQVELTKNTGCSSDKEHSDSSDGNRHCKEHCGHPQIGALSKASVAIPTSALKRGTASSDVIPESVSLEKNPRPPNS